jgi:hypothetical protein
VKPEASKIDSSLRFGLRVDESWLGRSPKPAKTSTELIPVACLDSYNYVYLIPLFVCRIAVPKVDNPKHIPKVAKMKLSLSLHV